MGSPMTGRAATRIACRALLLVMLSGSATHAAEGLPRTPSGRPDFSGVWTNKPARWPTLAYVAEYQAILDQRTKDEAAGIVTPTPPTRCLPPGLPWIMTGGAYPMEVYQWDSQITMIRENLGSLRRIQLKRGHDPDSGLSYNGDSVGHWEGDTLVVDTVNIDPDEPIVGILPHSDAFHVVERMQLVDANTFTDTITIDDAKALTKPATVTVTYTRDSSIELREYVCESNRNGYDANGKPFIIAPER